MRRDTTDHHRPNARIGGLFLAVLIFSVFTNLLMLTGPIFMLQVYDRVLASRSEETLVGLFGLVVVLYAAYGLLDLARGRVMARIGARLVSSQEVPVFRSLIEGAGTSERAQSGTGADLDAIRAPFTTPALLSVFDVPWTPIFLAAIFLFHPLLGWLAVAGVALLSALALGTRVLTRRREARANELRRRAHRRLREAETAGDIIRAQAMGRHMQARWRASSEDAAHLGMQVNDWTGSVTSISRASRFLLQAAMLALGAWLVLSADLTPGAMIAASILLGRALAPLESAIAHGPTLQRAGAAWRRLARTHAAEPSKATATVLPDATLDLSLDGITVIPPGRPHPVLRGVSLSLGAGQALGVIGRSGAGKSTLARVITGCVSPTSGSVRLGGVSLDQYPPERFGALIGYLPQDPTLFEGTVAENIGRMEQAPDAERVVAAARRAGVHRAILGLPAGYDTSLGPSGAPLSGGERQRIALARALYTDPRLLVLDEPASALDAEGTEVLTSVVSEMTAQGRSVILMTHRPAALTSCDQLLVLDNGRVTAAGPRDTVLRATLSNAGAVAATIAERRAS